MYIKLVNNGQFQFKFKTSLLLILWLIVRYFAVSLRLLLVVFKKIIKKSFL